MTATTDEAAFIRAICANPGDDTARLVYADWLEEHATATVECPTCLGTKKVGYMSGWPYTCHKCDGQGLVSDSNGNAERAEFIRVQCELARDWPDHSDLSHHGTGLCRGCVLRRRERELFENGHTYRWGFPRRINCTPFPKDFEEGRGPDTPVGLIRRGFVAVARLTLAALLGGECENCGGDGEFTRENSDGPRGPCPECGGKWNSGPHFDGDSYWDKGTGRVGGCAAELAAACPTLERVELSDCRPGQWPSDGNLSDRAWMGPRSPYWHPIHRDVLPAELFDLLPDDRLAESHAESPGNMAVRVYRDTPAALDALSAACLAHARSQAVARGLVPAGLWGAQS